MLSKPEDQSRTDGLTERNKKLPSHRYHAPGEDLPLIEPGDVVLTHADGFIHGLIRFGQRLIFKGDRRKFAYWNHAAIVHKVDRSTKPSTAYIAEALGQGVILSDLNKYKDTEFVLIELNPTYIDRLETQNFVQDVLDKREKYNYLEILSIALTLLIPLPIQFGSPGTAICSGLVANALTRAGVIWPCAPDYAYPATIAQYYNISEPS